MGYGGSWGSGWEQGEIWGCRRNGGEWGGYGAQGAVEGNGEPWEKMGGMGDMGAQRGMEELQGEIRRMGAQRGYGGGFVRGVQMGGGQCVWGWGGGHAWMSRSWCAGSCRKKRKASSHTGCRVPYTTYGGWGAAMRAAPPAPPRHRCAPPPPPCSLGSHPAQTPAPPGWAPSRVSSPEQKEGGSGGSGGCRRPPSAHPPIPRTPPYRQLLSAVQVNHQDGG